MTRLFIIALAVTVLNTMPIWLAELAEKSGISDVAVGLLASVVMLCSAVGCAIGADTRNKALLRGAGIVAFSGITGAATVQGISTAVLFVGAGGVGLAFGVVLALPLSRSFTEAKVLRTIGIGMAIGCAASFILLVVVHVAEWSLLTFLALLSAIQIILLFRKMPAQNYRNNGHFDWKRDISLLPFFICMGAYWAFLEVFSAEQDLGSLSAWLAASLLLSGLGSCLAGIVPNRLGLRAKIIGLLLAAFAGGLTYLSKTEFLVGMTILLNAFGLFLFFPLYLDRTDTPAAGMARYLLCFALGGVIGSLAIAVGGYTALAAAVVLSGLIAVPAMTRLRPKTDIPEY
ncbi:hypothetical protein [Ruegeria lacuscaerulensis]|uniref:hypothetical protein n=1 Tax=Ruegeria lacuscaerulensis TaxID=55218 RepID=UPI00147BA452|nr:hypothetical protein [Ruegeria lacuscaerulensis]